MLGGLIGGGFLGHHQPRANESAMEMYQRLLMQLPHATPSCAFFVSEAMAAMPKTEREIAEAEFRSWVTSDLWFSGEI